MAAKAAERVVISVIVFSSRHFSIYEQMPFLPGSINGGVIVPNSGMNE